MYLYQKHHFKIERIEQETHDSVSVYISNDNMSEFEFKSGQFLLIRVLESSLWWQVHPFSISERPNGEYIRLSIKDIGDYSHKIIGVEPGLRVFIDGPLGRFTKELSQKEKVLFIAAGSGITPIRPLMEELGLENKDIILLYGNKTKKDIMLHDEIESLSEKYEIPIHYYFSREEELEAKSNYYKGRIDLSDIQELVPDLFEREIFMCAPPEMMRQLRIELPKIGFPSKYIYYEQYNW
jgi:ferredoxin-NADP reductase